MSTDATARQESTASTWTRGDYFVWSDKSLLSLTEINAAFGAEYVYWTTALPENVLQQVINGSFCLGLYHNIKAADTGVHGERRQIGFIRFVTDNTTFAYITDMYVVPEYQGAGLGGWLLDCINEHPESKPYLRWAMLRTCKVRTRDAYMRRFGMQVLESGTEDVGPFMIGKKGKGNT